MTKRCIDVDDLYRLKLVGDAQISPDGTRVAYVVKYLDKEKDDYVGNIWLWDGTECRQFTSGGKDSAPRWSPDGRWLAFLSGREGKGQIFIMLTAGGEAIRLTDRKRGAGTPVWSPDNRTIAFTSGVPTVEDPPESEEDTPRIKIIDRAKYKFDGKGFVDDRRSHIFTVDIQTREEHQVTDGDVEDGEPAWSPEGTHIAFSANRSPSWDLESTSDIWIVPREGGEPRRVNSTPGQWFSPVFSPDGSRIAFVGYAIREGQEPTWYPQLWMAPRGGGKPCHLFEGTDLAAGDTVSSDWSIAGEGRPIWTDAGIVLVVSEGGTSNVVCVDGGVQHVTSGNHHVMDVSAAGDDFAFTVSDPCRPAEVTIQRGRAAGMGQIVSEHNAETLREVCPVEPERVTFTGAGGVEIDGWLMKPATFTEDLRYPLIVYVHGGPVGAYGDTFFHEFQNLAASGFGVFYCNPHGGSSYGQAFQSSIIGAWGTRDYEDMMAAADWVVTVPWVDPNRVGVAGGSYGGFMVNWLTSHTDRFAAAVTERSVCNHVSQGGTSDMAATRSNRLGATPEGDPERLWAQSPLKYVANVRTPTLVMHSERDDRCPIEQGEQWFAALKRLGVPTRFIRFPEESHGLSRGGKPSRRAARLGYIVDWFKTYL